MPFDEQSLPARLAAALAGPAHRAGEAERLAAIDTLVMAAASVTAIARRARGAPPARALLEARSSAALEVVLRDGLATLGMEADWSAVPDLLGGADALLGEARDGLEAWVDLDEAVLGLAREESLRGDDRRARGAHSTPPALASAIVTDALEVWRSEVGTKALPTVLDPTCGGGALLIAAARALVAETRTKDAEEHAELRRAIADRHLFGIELDEATARVARAAIALFGASPRGDPPNASARVLTGDVLLSIDRDEIVDALRVDDPATSMPALAEDLANALVDGFFATSPSSRAATREVRVATARRAASGDTPAREALTTWSDAGRSRGAVHPTLRWGNEGFDVALLNPPFLGGKRIGTVHGERYAAWLAAKEPHATGNADLAAHVLLATRRWSSPRAVLGFVATNSLAEGATREAGLERLSSEGFAIRRAERSAPWPGVASVSVVRATLARGGSAARAPRLDGREVSHIDGGLRAMPWRAPPRALAENGGLGFVGCFLRGEGFVLTPEEAHDLLEQAPESAACLRPYLVGRDVLRDPLQRPSRWVIDFGERTLDEAAEFPALLRVVRERVRPFREGLPDSTTNRGHRAAWWRFANPRPELRRALLGHATCFVAPRVAKHLAFARVPTTLVFSEQLVVITTSAIDRLGVLASTPHEAWARAHSSSLQAGLRYLPSRALATFPFPEGSSATSALEDAAEELLEAQVRATSALGIGLTKLRDLEAGSTRAAALREVIDARAKLDRATLAAYGWSDLAAPPPSAGATTRDAFAIEVVQRLATESERRGRREGSLV